MSDLKSIFTKAWNTFLDTTPREWGICISQVFSLLSLPTLSRKSLLAALQGPQGGAFALSLVLHLSPVVWLWAQSVNAPAGEPGAITTLKDILKNPKVSEEAAASEALEIFGISYFNGTESKKTTLMPSKISGLLKSLRMTNTAWASIARPSNQHVDTTIAKKTVEQKNWQELSKEQQLQEKKTVAGKLDEILSKEISQYDSQFQSCYEKSLLQDSTMNGKIEFLVQMGSAQKVETATVRFDGVGLPESKKSLENCLKAVASKIRFPAVDQENIAGKKLKFFVVLKSR